MIKFAFSLFIILFIGCQSRESAPQVLPISLEVDTTQTLTKIAFGSCNKSNADQPMWSFIVQNKPDLWIWLGDIIYGDSNKPSVLKEKYLRQKTNPQYRLILDNMPVIGIWDDHDYGSNDGDKNFKIKKESQQLLLDFLDVPASDKSRLQEGAYSSHSYGKEDQRVKIILLDGRYFRDTLKPNKMPGGQRYRPNLTGDILGEDQWEWLENELTNSSAKIHLIGCGIQVVAEEHNFEKWSNFPTARKRLIDLLNKTQPNRVILLSGDRHIAEISKMALDSLAYPLYDLTSSGLTHSYESILAQGEPNKYRVDNLITGEKNFGILDIDWNSIPPSINISILGLENKILLSHQLE